MTAGWVLRNARAFGLSVVSLALAVVAHTTAGGLLPPAWCFGVMLALCTLGNAPWLGREASRLKIIGLLIMGQGSMHFAMSAIAGHAGEEPRAHATVGEALADAVGHLIEDLSSHAPMALAHLAAAVVTGLWLAWGERALWRFLRTLAQLAGRAVLRLVPPTASAPAFACPAPPAARFLAATPLSQVFLADTHVRRGPPDLLGAF